MLVPGILPIKLVPLASREPPFKNIPPPGFALAFAPGNPFFIVELVILSIPPLE